MSEQTHETYSRDEIRRALGSAMDPLSGREVCDVLGCASRKERDGVYKALSLMAGHKCGIEQLDDGRYSLIPGWVDGRPAAASERQQQQNAERRAAKRQDPMLGVATRDRQVNPERVAAPPVAVEPAAEIVPPPAEVDDAMRERALQIAEAPSLSPMPQEPGAPANVASATAPRAAHAPRLHQERLRSVRADEIALPRRIVRALVAAVLTHGGSLSDVERHAVIEATRLAA